MHDPFESDWRNVKHLLRYLKGSFRDSLIFYSKSNLSLQAFSDADGAGCNLDCKSISGFLVYLGCNLISWSSKKQSTVACSTIKANKDVANATAELIWIQSLLRELQVPLTSPPTLHCNNIGAT